jgi:hypothetical protein
MEGRKDPYHPYGPTSPLRNKVHPWAPTSPLGANLAPGGQPRPWGPTSPLGANLAPGGQPRPWGLTSPLGAKVHPGETKLKTGLYLLLLNFKVKKIRVFLEQDGTYRVDGNRFVENLS